MRRCADKAGGPAGCVMSACGACVTVVVSEYESKIKHLQESHNTLRKVAHALGTCYCWDYGCEPAGVDDLLFRVRDLLDLECEKLDREFAPRPSRREQRLARKAAKNLVMYKRGERKPWNYFGPRWDVMIPWDALAWPKDCIWGKRELRLWHLREPSGFKAMSRVADQVALDAKLAALNAKHQAGMAKLEADGINIYADPEHM